MINKFANPRRFEKIQMPVMIGTLIIACIALPIGQYLALFASPADYQQGEFVRLIYIHVPAAWLGMGIYAAMGVLSFTSLVWRHRVAELLTLAAAPVGLFFTAICLISGSIWGKPIWGTWWEWDARLTSVLVLFLFYCGYILLYKQFRRLEAGLRAGSMLLLAGSVNLPIIKYSVEWFHTLHQTASLTSMERMANPAMPAEMLIPLLINAIGFAALSGYLILKNYQRIVQQLKNH